MGQVFLPKAYFRGQFVDFDQANISIATHALHYGTAAFGGLRGIQNPNKPDQILLFRLDKHAKRLSNSSRYLNYSLEADFIYEKIVETIKINKPTKPIYIRPFVYTSDLGIAPRLHNIEKDFLIYGIEMGDYLNAKGVKVCFSSWVRSSDNATPTRGKISANYYNSAISKTEAHNRGFDEALMLDTQGYVAEASAMNIFIYKDETLVTPPLNSDILEGITRQSVITLAKDLGYKVVQRPIAKSELLIADEVFLTGTAAKITPVYQIEFFNLPEAKPLSTKLKDEFSKINLGQNPKYEDWITRIDL